MLFLFESNVPESKSVFFALTYIYGIGKTNSILICKKLGFSKNLKVKLLSKDQITQLIRVVELTNLDLSSNLKKIKLLTTKKLVSIKSYRGLRRLQGFPVRGQRTHSNAKTSRKRG
jgi:small subunit ribosomal protein S13